MYWSSACIERVTKSLVIDLRVSSIPCGIFTHLIHFLPSWTLRSACSTFWYIYLFVYRQPLFYSQPPLWFVEWSKVHTRGSETNFWSYLLGWANFILLDVEELLFCFDQVFYCMDMYRPKINWQLIKGMEFQWPLDKRLFGWCLPVD